MTDQGIDYVAVLREVGFSPEWAVRGAEAVASESRAGDYPGFRTMVNLLQIQGAQTVWHDHQIEPVVRRVEAQEAAARISEHAGAAGLRVAARSAQHADDRARAMAQEAERTRLLGEVAARMTEDEYEGRVPLRPEIEEAFREAAEFDGELRVGSRPRPSWVGRAPGPVAVQEAASGASTLNPDGSTTITSETRDGRTTRTYIPIREDEPADVGDLVETFKVFGLSDEAAKHAAEGR